MSKVDIYGHAEWQATAWGLVRVGFTIGIIGIVSGIELKMSRNLLSHAILHSQASRAFVPFTFTAQEIPIHSCLTVSE